MATQTRTGIDCLHFIGGSFVSSHTRKTFENTNPATDLSVTSTYCS